MATPTSTSTTVYEAQGSVAFSVYEELRRHEYAVSVTTDDKLLIWVQDTVTFEEWQTRALGLSDFVTVHTAIPQATVKDYAMRISTALSRTSEEASLGRNFSECAVHDKSRTLFIAFVLQVMEFKTTLVYTFQLFPQPVDHVKRLSMENEKLQTRLSELATQNDVLLRLEVAQRAEQKDVQATVRRLTAENKELTTLVHQLLAEKKTLPKPDPVSCHKPSNSGKGAVIGIDLGSSKCCVGVWHNGRVEIVPDEEGRRTMLSCVAMVDATRCVVGSAAVLLRHQIVGVKQLMGRMRDEVDMYERHARADGKVQCATLIDGASLRLFEPEEISAMLLAKMKRIAETHLQGQQVTHAVISVPASFNDAQRRATRDAALVAGLNVLHLVNEPSAAAIAYGFGKSLCEHNALVFDMGAGTLDVSLIHIHGSQYEVKATAGSNWLGGQQFTERLVQHFMKKMLDKHGMDCGAGSLSQAVMQRIRKACEAAKKTLSAAKTATIDIECVYQDTDFHGTVTRVQFEQMCRKDANAAIELVTRVLQLAQIAKEQVDEVVLIGGSTRLPQIQKLLNEFFDGKKLCRTVNCDEAVALGATQLAAKYSREHPPLEEIRLVDVIPEPLGIALPGRSGAGTGARGGMVTLAKRHTRLPFRVTRAVSMEVDDQQLSEQCGLSLFEGEDPETCNNILLGSLSLCGVPLRSLGQPLAVDIVFDVDICGVFTIAAIDTETGKRLEWTSQNVSLTPFELTTAAENVTQLTKKQ